MSPPLEIQGTMLRAKSSNLDPQELRMALLFWDRLVWPSSRAIYFGSGPDEQFLEKVGVLTRPEYTFMGDAAQGTAKSYMQAFKDRYSKEQGLWSLSQGESALLWLDQPLEHNGDVALNLHRAIPVPDRDVPLSEILDFKEKRRDELLKLRVEIDRLVGTVEAADDRNEAMAMHAKLVDDACANVLRVSHEWQFPVRLTNLKASMKVRVSAPTMAAIGTGTYGFATAVHMPSSAAVLAAIGSALSATIPSFEWSNDLGWTGLRKRLGPYRYVYQFHKELF